MPWVKAVPDGVRLQVQVQPRAAKNQIAGVQGDGEVLKVRLTAPPVEGKANRLLQQFLGKFFGCGPGRVSIIRGATGRIKLVEVAGVTTEEIVEAVNKMMG